MSNANTGDTVKVHYTGKLSDGTVFDSSESREPFEFKLGEGEVISGFENAINGMAPGDTKTVEVPAGEAYGEHRDDLVIEVESSQIPSGVDIEVGTVLGIRQPDGQDVPVTVVEIRDDAVVIDGNHRLAGKDLTFEITLVEISGLA